VKGKSRLGIQPVPVHDIAIHLNHAEARGEDLPIAIAVSNEPIIAVCAAMPILYDQSEYKMAAVLQGKPYPVVRTDKGLDVPWGSEYVLEGRILARTREPEGPFGEFPGQYSGGRNYPVIEIDRVSHCKDPIYDISRGRQARGIREALAGCGGVLPSGGVLSPRRRSSKQLLR
jgi:UbiD family decarboxylase